MKFSKAKEEQLRMKIVDIILKCVLEAKKHDNDITYLEEWYIMEKVYYAGLVETPKEYFLLGQLTQKMHDATPKALQVSMQAAGIIKDESKVARCSAYWTEKYGDKKALVLAEKLATAFMGEKYSLEDIKSMGDKIALFNSWEHA